MDFDRALRSRSRQPPAPHTRRSCRTATLVALGQLHHLPVARENCGSECDHQIMISEMLIGVKENLSETLRPGLCAPVSVGSYVFFVASLVFPDQLALSPFPRRANSSPEGLSSVTRLCVIVANHSGVLMSLLECDSQVHSPPSSVWRRGPHWSRHNGPIGRRR